MKTGKVRYWLAGLVLSASACSALAASAGRRYAVVDPKDQAIVALRRRLATEMSRVVVLKSENDGLDQKLRKLQSQARAWEEQKRTSLAVGKAKLAELEKQASERDAAVARNCELEDKLHSIREALTVAHAEIRELQARTTTGLTVEQHETRDVPAADAAVRSSTPARAMPTNRSAKDSESAPASVRGVSVAARLAELEKKARDRDFAINRNDKLHDEVSQLRQALVIAQTEADDLRNKAGTSRLQELERTALAYSTLQSKLLAREDRIVELERELAEERTKSIALGEQLVSLQQEVAELTSGKSGLEEEVEGLRASLHQFQLGRFEFYEVKEGDSATSIAADPLIYADSGKAELIRQANRQRVGDIDNLRAGEVLVIPRFPPTGRYQF